MEELKVTVSFECEEEVRTWLRNEARKEHRISVSSLLRKIIDFYRQNNHNGNGPQNGEAAA